MANSFINSDLLSKEAAAHFTLNNTFYGTANHSYDGMFTDRTYDAGDTINIRLSNFGKVQRGDTVIASDIVETSLPLTLQQLYSYPVAYTTEDLSTKIRENTWKERVFYPGVNALIAEINKDIAALAALTTYNYVGTPGTAISTFAAVDEVSAEMDEMAVPMANRYMALTPSNSSSLKSALQNSFNQTLNEGISLASRLGHLSTFDMFSEQLIATHSTYSGALGTPVVNGAVSSGNTIVLSGLTASITGIFKAGDVIEFDTDTLHKVDPISKSDTGRRMQFVITQDADSGIGGACTITVSPSIIGDSTNPNQNIINVPAVATNEIPNGAALLRPDTHKCNLAYTNESLYMVTPPLVQFEGVESSTFRDPKTGVSLRVSKTAEVLSNKNIMRIDILTGFLWIPSHTWRIIT